jgi:hypothetical protein
MKRILTAATLLFATHLAAQTPDPVPVEPRAPTIPQVSLSRFSGYRSPSAFSPIFSYGRYGIDGDFTSALIFGLAYSPNRRFNPELEFSGGLVLGRRGVYGEFVYQPLLYSRSSFMNPGYGGRAYTIPSYRLEMGFLGVGSVFYLAQGDVRPYVGAGLHVYSWQSQSSIVGTLSPEARAGLEITMSNGVWGFAEARHSIGMPNMFSGQASRFDGMTSFGFGFAFAPRF